MYAIVCTGERSKKTGYVKQKNKKEISNLNTKITFLLQWRFFWLQSQRERERDRETRTKFAIC